MNIADRIQTLRKSSHYHLDRRTKTHIRCCGLDCNGSWLYDICHWTKTFSPILSLKTSLAFTGHVGFVGL